MCPTSPMGRLIMVGWHSIFFPGHSEIVTRLPGKGEARPDVDQSRHIQGSSQLRPGSRREHLVAQTCRMDNPDPGSNVGCCWL